LGNPRAPQWARFFALKAERGNPGSLGAPSALRLVPAVERFSRKRVPKAKGDESGDVPLNSGCVIMHLECTIARPKFAQFPLLHSPFPRFSSAPLRPFQEKPVRGRVTFRPCALRPGQPFDIGQPQFIYGYPRIAERPEDRTRPIVPVLRTPRRALGRDPPLRRSPESCGLAES